MTDGILNLGIALKWILSEIASCTVMGGCNLRFGSLFWKRRGWRHVMGLVSTVGPFAVIYGLSSQPRQFNQVQSLATLNFS